MKASTNVRHIVMPCESSARAKVIPDIIRCYSRLVMFGVEHLFYSICGYQNISIFLRYVSVCMHDIWVYLLPVVAAPLFSLRQRSLLLNLLMRCLEHEHYMETYNSPSVR